MGRNIIEETEEAELQIKYENYIQKEKEIAQKISRLEDLRLDAKINYLQLPSLSSEAREKLTKIKPETIGQAARISGITPADISLLLVFLGK
jgi:tRNA uridine 5-carboxymethylaminomethyl modification enzyme